MKRSTKILLALLLAGLLGTAATAGILIGTGTLYSREASKTYPITNVMSAKAYTHLAVLELVPAQGDYRAEVYAKAWLEGPVDPDKIFSADVEGGALTVTETPFPSTFLGLFPQPYEMKITLYLPESVLASLEEVRR
ncbi:MAG: hypothetical protein AAGU74_14525 [Bacillota bacterium]